MTPAGTEQKKRTKETKGHKIPSHDLVRPMNEAAQPPDTSLTKCNVFSCFSFLEELHDTVTIEMTSVSIPRGLIKKIIHKSEDTSADLVGDGL